MKIIRMFKALALVWVLIFSCVAAMPALAEMEDIDYLSWEDVKKLGLEGPMYNYALAGDTIFAMNEETIWSWKVGEKDIHQKMKFVSPPARDEYIAFEKLSKKEQKILLAYPGKLFNNGDELWSFNPHSFKLGKVGSDAVAWSVQLEKPSKSVKELFVSGEYVLGLLNNDSSVDYDIQLWELASGKKKEISVPGVSYAAPHQAGKALLICDAYTENPTFKILDLGTGEMEALPLKMPFACKNNMWNPITDMRPRMPFQGFVYDTSSDTILFAAHGKLWASKAGAEFQSVAQMPDVSPVYLKHGWILPDGRYITQIEAGISVRKWR